MKSISSRFAFSSVAFGLAMATTFIACGDENTTKVNESVGLDVVAKGDTLPQCGNDNVGEMIFVADSSAVYYCADEKWTSLDGKDGEQGAKGDLGEKGSTGGSGKNGDSGTGCTAKTVEDGVEVTCGDTVIGVIKNGEPGKAIKGEDGNSCSATLDEESKNILITCETDDGKGVSYTIQNGSDGKSIYELSGSDLSFDKWLASLKGDAGENCTIANYAESGKTGYKITCGNDEKILLNGMNGSSCSVKEEDDGKVNVTCGDGEPVTLSKPVCGDQIYNPSVSGCCGQTVFSLEKSICDYRDKQVYRIVTIEGSYEVADEQSGTKTVQYKETWMAENLNRVVDDGTRSWCYNQGKDGVTEEEYKKNCETYGRLYTWGAAVGKSAEECGPYGDECSVSGTVQGICPDDWHLPSYEEWDALRSIAGGEDAAGGSFKSASGWNDFQNKSGGGTDVYGFSALPGGYLTGVGNSRSFTPIGVYADFWSSKESMKNSYTGVYTSAYYIEMNYSNNRFTIEAGMFKRNGLSVRCIKDKDLSLP